MVKRVVIGGLLGGVVLFTWLGIWWSALPVMNGYFHEMPDGAAVAAGMEAANLEAGFYFYPSPTGEFTEEAQELMIFGPLLGPVNYVPEGCGSQVAVMLKGFAFTVANSMLAMLILSMIAAPIAGSYWRRVLIATAFGAMIGIGGPLVTGNFFAHPPGYAAMELVSLIVGWFLSGLVLAWQAKPLSAVAETN